jgi:Tfp pilus assembly protein PilO
MAEQNQKANNKKKSFIPVIDKRVLKPLIIFGIIILIAIIAIIISFSNIKKQSMAIKQLRTEYNQLLEQSELYSNLQKNAKAILVYNEAVKKLIPDKTHLIDFSDAINQLANKHNLELGLVFKDVANQEEKKAIYQNIDQAIFSMNIRGKFSDFINFLKDLKEFPYYVDFYTFNIANISGSSTSPEELISYNIEGRIFIQK